MGPAQAPRAPPLRSSPPASADSAPSRCVVSISVRYPSRPRLTPSTGTPCGAAIRKAPSIVPSPPRARTTSQPAASDASGRRTTSSGRRGSPSAPTSSTPAAAAQAWIWSMAPRRSRSGLSARPTFRTGVWVSAMGRKPSHKRRARQPGSGAPGDPRSTLAPTSASRPSCRRPSQPAYVASSGAYSRVWSVCGAVGSTPWSAVRISRSSSRSSPSHSATAAVDLDQRWWNPSTSWRCP